MKRHAIALTLVVFAVTRFEIMGFIERTYQSTVSFISTVGESQYADLASELGFAARTISIILIVVVLINMATQTRPTEASASIWMIVKLSLVALFMQSWTQFYAVFLAFDQMFEILGQRLLTVSMGASETTSFAAALDNLSVRAAEFASAAAGRLNILGAVLNGIMVLLIGAFGALATLALTITKVVLALLISLAPLAIVASLTTVTKSFFEAWLTAMVSMLMFPLILSGIFATILAMGNGTIESLTANSGLVIGSIIPVVMVVILSIFMLVLSPVILSMLTGSMQVGMMAGALSGALSGPFKGSWRMGSAATGGIVGGMMGASGKTGMAGAGQAAGGAMRGAAANTAGFMKPSQFANNLSQGVDLRASQLNRMSERMDRFRRK